MNIDNVMEQLTTIVNNSARVPGTQRRMVDKTQLEAILEQLKTALPNEIQEAQEILHQKEAIVNAANLEAQRMRKSAQDDVNTLRAAAEQEYRAKVSETEVTKLAQKKAEETSSDAHKTAQAITQDAQKRAQRTLDEAEATAEKRRTGADQYAREVLFSLEERLSELLSQVRRGLDVLGTPTPASR